MERKSGKKIAGICAIIAVALLVFTLVFGGKDSFIADGVKTAFTPVLSGISGITHEIRGFKDYFTDIKAYKDENTELSLKNSELEKNALSVAQYKEENERLNDLLSLKNEMEDKYNPVAAKVVSYEPNNWYDTIVINKGKWSGVCEGDAVISTSGVVGKVIEVGSGYSVVSTVINYENTIGVRVARDKTLAVVEGDKELSKQKLCKMSYISNSDIHLGDLIETTNSSGIYPEGVNVGTVKEIRAENATPYAVIEPSADLSNLYEVIVVCRGDAAND